MTKIDKLLLKMRNNLIGWHIDDLKKLADRYNITYRQPGTSHVTFSAHNCENVTVPAHKTIKSVYVKAFLALIDAAGEKND
jgi:hypothetical protein